MTPDLLTMIREHCLSLAGFSEFEPQGGKLPPLRGEKSFKSLSRLAWILHICIRYANQGRKEIHIFFL